MDELSLFRSMDAKLSAILALLATVFEESGEKGRKAEIPMANVGLPATQIAKFIGKKPDTVIKSINRLGKSKK